MWDIKPGDLVVFVGLPGNLPEPTKPYRKPPLVEGDIYTVRRIRTFTRARVPYVSVEERHVPGTWTDLYHYRCFRPVAKPSIEGLRALLAPTPAKAPAHAS